MLLFTVFALFFTLQHCSSTCQNRQLLTDSSGVVTDGASTDYNVLQICAFLISLSNSSDRILLSFELINTECGWDYLTVFDGESYADPILMSISGDLLTDLTSDFTRLEVCTIMTAIQY